MYLNKTMELKSVPFEWGLDVDKPAIPDVLPQFVEYLRINPSWGSLHIVLDDGNVADSHVQFCIDYAERNGDSDGAALGRVLLAMSKTQRGKIDRVAYEALTANDELTGRVTGPND